MTEIETAKARSPDTWTPQQLGRAVHMIFVLANTPWKDWRSRAELYDALAEFRVPPGEERGR